MVIIRCSPNVDQSGPLLIVSIKAVNQSLLGWESGAIVVLVIRYTLTGSVATQFGPDIWRRARQTQLRLAAGSGPAPGLPSARDAESEVIGLH